MSEGSRGSAFLAGLLAMGVCQVLPSWQAVVLRYQQWWKAESSARPYGWFPVITSDHTWLCTSNPRNVGFRVLRSSLHRASAGLQVHRALPCVRVQEPAQLGPLLLSPSSTLPRYFHGCRLLEQGAASEEQLWAVARILSSDEFAQASAGQRSEQ